MEVLLVHGKPLPADTGGAERTWSRLIEARPAGIEVTTVTPDADPALRRFDAVIIATLRPEGGVGEAEEYRLADLWRRKLRGYGGWSMVSEHDAQPCAMRDARCVQAQPLRHLGCGCGRAIPDAFRRLYQAASVVRFLSPGQRRVIGAIIPLPPRTLVIAPPIDFQRFRPLTPWQDRLDRALALADPVRHGPDAQAIARTHGLEMDVLPYGSVDHADMPALLNRYRHVLMAPVAYHAFGRLAAEALACGCKLLSNGRVGALSWPDPLAASRAGEAAFWNAVALRQPPAKRSWSRLIGLLGR
jgi:glycosyltransferase involved in cell wall biosynthesis